MMPRNMPGHERASTAPSQPQLRIKETYFQTPTAVPSPDASPDNAISPMTRSVFANPGLRRDSKHEPPADRTMRYNPTIEPTIATFKENKTMKKRLTTLFSSAWRAVRKCIYSPPLSELDDVKSSTARLLYADRYQPIYGHGSIAAGAKPTIISDNPSAMMDSAWSSPQRGSNPRRARPTPKENFVV
ncbi:uncharacterized protein M421DRAFT_302189 [Didymella exigua CBS 183.55]|uniref:Uncharacterized protein n=1 Tax=Didymella exigua CBS 183.55 TaxID=1150837 RepID=A0A6A5R8K1_9PLEO|nr:uncharacterized protein M421DRAFT_302189 [Didymella exigua CBS 183.55]KAF1923953.1 hypothetical protein M421DRAFT_302189 [Didymella exigua CBS 183.55]